MAIITSCFRSTSNPANDNPGSPTSALVRLLVPSPPAHGSAQASQASTCCPANQSSTHCAYLLSKLCIGDVAFRVGALKSQLNADEKKYLQAALNNIDLSQPPAGNNGVWSYQASYTNDSETNGPIAGCKRSPISPRRMLRKSVSTRCRPLSRTRAVA